MWDQIKALILKEILIIFRDKKSRLALIGPPIMQLLIFSHAATLEVRNISIGLYNQDLGAQGYELMNRIQGSPYFKNVYFYQNMQEVTRDINKQKVLVSLRIPPDFSQKIANQQPASLQIILDGRKSNASQIVQGYLLGIIQNLNQSIVDTTILNSPRYTVNTVFRAWFNENLDYIQYTVPCLVGILSMVLGITLTALSVARERELGTFDQLLVSPLQPWQILMGKTLPSLIIGVLESMLLMILVLIFFSVPFRGSLLMFLFSLNIFVMSVIGIGLFISSISQTQQQAILGAFVFMIPAMLISGYATPIENMPHWLQVISQFFPNTHFFIIIKGVFLKAMPPLEILRHTWPMLLIGCFTLTIAGWMFKQRL